MKKNYKVIVPIDDLLELQDENDNLETMNEALKEENEMYLDYIKRLEQTNAFYASTLDELNSSEKASESISLETAIRKLVDSLSKDNDYYRSWKDNIAMAFQDIVPMNKWVLDDNKIPTKTAILSKKEIHKISNNAADNFLKILIKEVSNEPKSGVSTD